MRQARSLRLVLLRMRCNFPSSRRRTHVFWFVGFIIHCVFPQVQPAEYVSEGGVSEPAEGVHDLGS